MKLDITREQFIELYNSCTYKQIAKQLNISEPTIAKIAKKLGLKKQVGRPKENIEFKASI